MARTGMPQESDDWEIKFREDEEMEFFTELALHETERWIQAVTRMKFPYPDDPRKSLEDGILLCELLNCIKNSSVKRINRQAAPIAGLDNVNVFLNACRSEFGLYETQLFNPADLEDLSHRAIADSDQLKQESDRRLRNVAITIYWLGRVVAEQNYQVPGLDLSAFTPLINHNAKDIISNDHIYKHDHSWDHSYEHSSAYESNGFSRSVINQSYDSNHNHFRDSSYESYASYGKGSEESLDDPNYNNMPVGRYSQPDGKRYFGGNDSVYREDKYNGMYRSSPDLAVPSYNHRRSSSTDSLDGSYRGSHSRQSSDSCDGYPTRNLSRRTSSSIADPLQFIKSKGAEDMAKQATEQIKQVEEIKKMKTPSISESSKEDDDWQSTLGSWKSRRKSRSEAFQIKEEQEEQEKKKQEEERINKASPQKSFKQIQEERERRKSAGKLKSFYPVEDEDEEGDNDAFFSPIKSSTIETESSSFTKIKSSTPSNKSKSEVAAWGRDSESDSDESCTESGDKNNSLSLDNKTKDSSDFNQSNNSMHNLSHNNNKNISKNSDKSHSVDSDRDTRGVLELVKQRNSRNNDISSANKINDIRNKFESPSDKPVSRTTVFDAKVDLKERKKSFEMKPNDSDIGRPPRPYPRERGGSNQVPVTVETTSPVYASSKDSSKDYVEKNIKITSKHNNSGGFGFTVSGGTDRHQPVIVERVSLGSAADICELKSKDEILLVNKQEVSRLTNQDVNNLIQQAANQGSIEIRVKRFLDSNVEDSDEFLSSDEDESTKKQSPTRETTHSFDSTLSQDEDRPLYNNNNVDTNKSNGKVETSQISSEYSEQPLMQQLKNDASLQRQFDQHNDSSYQSAENISQSYSSYGSSNNASSLDNSDYTTNQPVSYTSTNPEPVKSENTYVRTRISHHDYVNTSSLDNWGYGNHDNQYGNQGNQDGSPDNQPEVVMRRKKQNVEESVASSSSFDETDRVRSPDVGSSDSDGPPAILRKWQRQRPTSEYKIQDEKSIITQKRLSATLPWQPDHLGIEDRPEDPVLERARRDFTDTVSSQPIPSVRSNQIDVREDRKRIEAWNNEQELKRQPDDLNAAVVNNNQSFSNQAEFEANREQMAKQYEEEQKRASKIQQQNEIKERELLEPEMERMRISEERRQERRKRLQDLHLDSEEPITNTVSQPIEITEMRATLSYNTQDKSRPINSSTGNFYPTESSRPTEITQTRSTISYSAPQHHTYQNVYEPNYVNQPTTDVSTMNIHVADGRPVQMTTDPNQPTMSYMLPSNQSGGLVIDPRNRLNESEPVPQYSIQLNLNQHETPQGLVIQPEIRSIPVHDANFLEQEKEKIRLEYQKFEETFRKQQDEEDRKFQEREQKLREQEEKLRREEERLRKEEEKLERERQNLRKSTEFSQSNPPKFHDPVPTRVRGQSALYKSTVSAPNRTEPKPKPSTYSTSMVIDNNHNNRHNVNKVEPAWPPKPRHPGNISVHRSHDHWTPGAKTHDVKNINSAKRPNDFPSKDHHGDVQSLKSRFSEPGQRKSWSREDMMAMNRKATPLQSKPENDSSPTSPSSTGPVKREIPTRQEIHSLNAVPKPKLRQSVDWIERSEQSPERRTAARRSDMMKNQYSDPLKGHWLIEEAERRRMNSDLNVKSSTMPIQPGPYNGPIKPPRDQSNVWSNSNPQILPNQRVDPNMPKQIRQTLLQKTATVRGSGGVNPQDSEPQIIRNPYLTQTMPPKSSTGYGGYDSPRNGANLPPSTSVPSPTNQGPVSGKQLCSACHQELGFGAAMIIEKLGLCYHMPCFKCCVCRMPLGNGAEGADVRIRVNKLHCPNCYSNDEGTQHR